MEFLSILLTLDMAVAQMPLESLEKFKHYFVQCQLQMICTGAEFCILQSYHPESKTSKFFIIKYNNTLMTIIQEIVDCIFDENHILDWDHTEIVEIQTLAKKKSLEKSQTLHYYDRSEVLQRNAQS